MQTNRRRLAITTGATLALVLAGASVAAAAGPDDPSGFGWDDTWSRPRSGDLDGSGRGGRMGRGPDDRGYSDAAIERMRQLVRSETTLDLGTDGGLVTTRVEHGTVAAVADGSLTITLSTGESAMVATDDETDVYAIDLAERPYRTDAEMADVVVGSEILAWSESQDDGSFLASKVTILPAADATTDATTDDGTASPEASPAIAG